MKHYYIILPVFIMKHYYIILPVFIMKHYYIILPVFIMKHYYIILPVFIMKHYYIILPVFIMKHYYIILPVFIMKHYYIILPVFIMKHYYIILPGFKLIQIIPWLRFVLGCSNGKIVREKNRHYDLYLIHVVKPMVCHMIGIHCNWWNLKRGPKNIQPFKWNIILEKSIYSIFNNFCEKKKHVRNENIINISFFKNVFTLTCYSFPC